MAKTDHNSFGYFVTVAACPMSMRMCGCRTVSMSFSLAHVRYQNCPRYKLKEQINIGVLFSSTDIYLILYVTLLGKRKIGLSPDPMISEILVSTMQNLN